MVQWTVAMATYSSGVCDPVFIWYLRQSDHDCTKYKKTWFKTACVFWSDPSFEGNKTPLTPSHLYCKHKSHDVSLIERPLIVTKQLHKNSSQIEHAC